MHKNPRSTVSASVFPALRLSGDKAHTCIQSQLWISNTKVSDFVLKNIFSGNWAVNGFDVFALASSLPLKAWHQRASLKIRPNLQFKGRNFIKLDVKGWRGGGGGGGTNPGATLPVEMYTVQHIGLQWPLCTTTGWSHKFAAAAVLLPTLDSPRVTLREGLLYSRTPSLPSKPKASRSPHRAHIQPTRGADIPRGNRRSLPLGCQCRKRLSAETNCGPYSRGFSRASKPMVSLDLQQTYPQHHKAAGKCHLQVLQVES